METIGVIEHLAQPTAAVRDVVPVDELGERFAFALNRVLELLTGAGVAPAGPPFARYRGPVGRTVDVEIGFPVPDGTAPVAGLVVDGLPACRAVEVLHLGGYDDLPDAYARVEAWADEHGVQLRQESWEVYEAGPSSDPDPATWRTRVVWPVAEPQISSAPDA